jgi:CheY-like chemotaxis protein
MSQKPVVLFVDDNQTQLDLYAMALESHFVVIKATRARAGLELASSERPDAIVMDIMLPDEDGLAALEQLKANPATSAIPVLMITGDDRAYARAQLVRDELTGVMLKPCAADRLVGALRMAIQRPRA